MKAYKVELLIVDHDEIGPDGILEVLQNTHFPNRCILPSVMNIIEKDIGEYGDDHPLNDTLKCEGEYKRIFG